MKFIHQILVTHGKDISRLLMCAKNDTCSPL